MASKPNRRNLDDALGNLGNEQPVLRRGEGVYLSTEEQPPVVEPAEERKPKVPVRSKLGYEIRKDLQKECRRIALETDRHAYEIVEDALARYIMEYNNQERKK